MGQQLSCCRLKWLSTNGEIGSGGGNGTNNNAATGGGGGNHQLGVAKSGGDKYRAAPYSSTNAAFGGDRDHLTSVGGRKQQRASGGGPLGDLRGGGGGGDLRYSNGFAFESQEKLQHISEREPEGFKKRYSVYEKKACRLYLTQQHRICSSCSSILLDDCTVSQPNGKACLKALALAIYFHIRNRESKGHQHHRHHHHGRNGGSSHHEQQYMSNGLGDEDLLEIFDERRHPIHKDPSLSSNDALKRDPDQREVYRFVRNLITMAQLTAECTVVTLVYLERLVTYAEMEVRPTTWRRQVLGAILLASKVWDDQAVWNVDFCNILKDLDVEDVNELERQYLELIQFNINIPPSVYAKYYFDLLALAEAHGLYNANDSRKALSKDRARKLEAMSSAVDDPFFEWTKSARGIRRFPSLDGFFSSPHFRRAVLS